MIDKTLHLLRAASLSLAVAFALAPLSAIADSAVVRDAATQMPSAIATDYKSGIMLAQQAPKTGPAVKSPDVKVTDGSEERAKVRDFLAEKTKWIKEQPHIKLFLSVLPALWTPFKVASLLLFLIGYIVFHFNRQRRNKAEADLHHQPSAHEAEFGITAEQRREV